MKTFAILIAGLLWLQPAFLSSGHSQEPVPDVTPTPAVVASTGRYFSGATDDEKRIIDLVRGQIDEEVKRPLRKRRYKKIVGKRRGFESLRQEISDEIVWGGEQPATMATFGSADVTYGAIGDGKIIEWLQNGGLEQILAFILAIIDALSSNDTLNDYQHPYVQRQIWREYWNRQHFVSRVAA